MRFDTVILFDTENLLGPRAHWKQAATELSFGDILAQLALDDSGLVGSFAVSRAYANWSLPELGTLRREMTEFGIEPRQIFAFDGAGKKNAADIELVIDALDLAYSREGLSTFVLVTRDGGFASVGRKLHELGRAVVVCADQKCSKSLRAVADAFVELPAADAGLVVRVEPTPATAGPGDEGIRLLVAARKDVLGELERLGGLGAGVRLQEVGQRLRERLPVLPLARCGYPGLKEFLQWATAESPYCVVRRGDPPDRVDFLLALRTKLPPGVSVLPGLDRRPPPVSDPVSVYRLLASQGQPILRLPEPGVTGRVLREVSARGISQEELAPVIIDVAERLAGEATTEDVKNVLVVLARSPALGGTPPDAPIAERRYTLADKKRSAAALRDGLITTVRQKLESRLGTVDPDVLRQVVRD